MDAPTRDDAVGKAVRHLLEAGQQLDKMRTGPGQDAQLAELHTALGQAWAVLAPHLAD